MIQTSLFDYTPPAPQSILGDRQGDSYDRKLDLKRLNKQAQVVWDVMSDGNWHTLAELHVLTGYPESSISARCRDFRKGIYGCNEETMESKRVSKGLWRYRLHPEKKL